MISRSRRRYRCPSTAPPAPKRRRSSQLLLSRQTHRSLRIHDGRGIPFSGQRLRLRTVEAHGQIEGYLTRRKPIGFLVLARVLVLEVKLERAVRILFERHPAADGEPVQGVANLESFRIV